MRTRDLFVGCDVSASPDDVGWSVRLSSADGVLVKATTCPSMEDTLRTVQQWLLVLDDDTQILDGEPSMQDEVVHLLREAILSMAIGEQTSLPVALTTLMERDRLRSWFHRQMDGPL